MKTTKTKISYIFIIMKLFILTGCSENLILYDELTEKGESYYYAGELFTGTAFDIFNNGQTKFKTSIINGKLNGKFREWDQSGQLIKEFQYVDNVAEGIAREWYHNGQLLYEVKYSNNEMVGILKEWDKEGNLVTNEDIEKIRYRERLENEKSSKLRVIRNILRDIQMRVEYIESQINYAANHIIRDDLIVQNKVMLELKSFLNNEIDKMENASTDELAVIISGIDDVIIDARVKINDASRKVRDLIDDL